MCMRHRSAWTRGGQPDPAAWAAGNPVIIAVEHAECGLPFCTLWCENDKLLPSRYAALWGERVPDVRIELIPRCGHLPHIEKAELTARKIGEFIASQ